MEQLEELAKMVENLGGISDANLAKLAAISEVKQFKKGDFLLHANTMARFSYFVLKGAVREFFTGKDGREYNKSFCFSGDFTGSYYDLNSGKPSLVHIQAMSGVKVIATAYAPLKKLIDKDAVWRGFAYQVAHQTLMKKLEKEYQLLCLSASERYAGLRKQQPQLEQLVPAYHLASYPNGRSLKKTTERSENTSPIAVETRCPSDRVIRAGIDSS